MLWLSALRRTRTPGSATRWSSPARRAARSTPQKYAKWRAAFVETLRGKFHYDPQRLLVLAETPGDGAQKATRENVRGALAELRKRMTKDDQLVVLLIGHGTSLDGDEAKFNLVGPDLSATEWSELLRPLPGASGLRQHDRRAAFRSCASWPAKGQVVLTATDAAAQQFETVFPEFFIKAFDDPAADLDRNGRVSIWEAFTYASAGVRQWFEQKGQLPTERPLLDDTGDGHRPRGAESRRRRRRSRASPISSRTPCWRCRPTRRSPA